METSALAGDKKKALQQGRTVVLVDESGLSERPHGVRTWSPRGQTPVRQYSFNWKSLSAMAGITIWNFSFRLFPGSIKAPQVIEFLEHLQRHIGGWLTIIGDGLPAHRSRMVREFVAGQGGTIQLEFLPADAPELNPVAYLWGYCKQHELPHLCPKDFGQLSCAARKALGRMRRRPTLVESFWKQAELF